MVKEERVYDEIVSKRFPEPFSWAWKAKNLAWRLHTPEAIRDLDLCIRAQKPPVDEFRLLAMAFASFRTDEERLDRINRLLALAQLPNFQPSTIRLRSKRLLKKTSMIYREN